MWWAIVTMATVGWVSGCIAVWSSLFTVGNFLYGRNGYGVACLAAFLVSGTVLLVVVNRIWTREVPEAKMEGVGV